MPDNRRCIVPHCTSVAGQFLCPLHRRIKCGCGSNVNATSFHKLPPSPGLRNVWLSLIGIDPSEAPEVGFVCSKHFDSGGKKKKVPTVNIGRDPHEIEEILQANVARILERHATRRTQTERDFACSLSKLANAVATVVEVLEESENSNFSHGEPKSCHMEHGYAAVETVLSGDVDSFPSTSKGSVSPVEGSSNAVQQLFSSSHSNDPLDIDNLSQEVQNVSIDDAERPRAPKRWPPSPRTPESASKRPCGMRTPTYGSKISDRRMCIEPACLVVNLERESLQGEVKTLQSEVEKLQEELLDHRIRLHLAEKKASEPCEECAKAATKVEALEEELNGLRASLDLLRQESNSPKWTPAVDITKIHPDRFYVLTGMHLSTFKIIFASLEPVARAATYWEGPAKTRTRQHPVSEEEKSSAEYEQEFILFLMRMRLGLNVELLGHIFGHSVGTVSKIFNTWLDLFSRRFSWLVELPDQWTCWSRLPAHIAEKFSRLRCIVDTTEVEIERPLSPYLQALTYSNYKKRNTFKFLVAILGDGAVAFISKAFTGRTSDKFIMNYCGLMDLLTAGDQVLCDRGFSITDEMLLKSIDLNIPPGGTGVAQFTTEEVYQTKKIANVRIHVERAIRRIKCYKILTGPFPITVLPVVDKILTSVAILCNLQDELVK